MFLVASALFLGFLHGLGADHLMAIAALSVSTTTETAAVQRARALSVALRFACGHAVLLAVGAGALLVLGWSLPLVFERASEMVGGAVLIVLGAVAIWGVLAGRVYGHSHRHGNEERPIGTSMSVAPTGIRWPRPIHICRRSLVRPSRSAVCAP